MLFVAINLFSYNKMPTWPTLVGGTDEGEGEVSQVAQASSFNFLCLQRVFLLFKKQCAHFFPVLSPGRRKVR